MNRLGVWTFDSSTVSEVHDLSGTSPNTLDANTNSKARIMEYYQILAQKSCGGTSGSTVDAALSDALYVAYDAFETADSDGLDRYKKIVIISNCFASMATQIDVCDEHYDIIRTGETEEEDQVRGDKNGFDVTIVNLPVSGSDPTYLLCLAEYDADRIYESSMDTEDLADLVPEVKEEICSEPTAVPTTDPTVDPTTILQ